MYDKKTNLSHLNHYAKLFSARFIPQSLLIYTQNIHTSHSLTMSNTHLFSVPFVYITFASNSFGAAAPEI